MRNCNPGNIRTNSDYFKGEIRPSRDSSFKQFKTMAYGYRAMFKILRNYHKNYKLDTIRKMITRWAPPSENKTEAYIKAVADQAAIDPDSVVNIYSEQQMCAIVAGMSLVENGREADMAEVRSGWNML